MLRNRTVQVAGIFLILIIANIISYIYWHWGLVTVKVTDAPLSKVISSIEWQGWVKIYTNLPPDTKVSMWVDHVPLAEAMDTLSASIEAPPPANDGADSSRRANGGAGGVGGPGGPGAGPRPDGGPGGGFAGSGGRPGGPGGPRPDGGGRGGMGRGAQWNLAFFVAPTSAQVREEIRNFQAGGTDEDAKIYHFPTALQMLATDDEMSSADPRLQTWPGIKPPQAPPPAPPAPPPAPTDAPADAPTTTPGAPPPGDNATPAVPAADTKPTLQTYLRAFAEAADIWIMTPASWDKDISTPPASNASIIKAVKKFVGNSSGAVTEAIILRMGANGGRGRGRGGFGMDDTTADRARNAINGLTDPDERASALSQLDQEVTFFKGLKAAPPMAIPQMLRSHFMDKLLNADPSRRRTPEKRAQMYQRVVANRMAAQGKTSGAK